MQKKRATLKLTTHVPLLLLLIIFAQLFSYDGGFDLTTLLGGHFSTLLSNKVRLPRSAL